MGTAVEPTDVWDLGEDPARGHREIREHRGFAPSLDEGVVEICVTILAVDRDRSIPVGGKTIDA